MNTTVEPHTQRRLTLVVWLPLVWGAILVARLVQLQVIEHEYWQAKAVKQQEHEVKVPARRGTILSGGSNGGPLAISRPVRRVVINPLRVVDIGFAVSTISTLLPVDATKLAADIEAARRARVPKQYLIIAEDASAEEIARLKASKLDIFAFENTYQRQYPKGTMAANLLGWVTRSGHAEAGLELGLDSELRGADGLTLKLRNSRNIDYDSTIINEEKPEPGVDITLTIDEAIQLAAERILKEAVEKEGVPSGTIVVMNPKTGDILAMASYPTFDPKDKIVSDDELFTRLNLTVAAPFEPGSIFKTFTIAAALETTRLRPESVINCGNGTMDLHGRIIHDHDGGFSALTMTNTLAKSSNICAIRIGLTVQNEPMYAYIRKFGFGERIGLPLPNEHPGMVHPVRDWSAVSMGSIAMGHELMTTPVQMAQAYAIVANNGLLVKARLVKARQASGKPKEILAPAKGEQRIRAETAIELRRMLEQVVLAGTATNVKLASEGYTTAGKTGTAQIVDPRTGKYLHRYNSSFVGFAPVANPEVVVAVTINGSYKYGGVTAGPVYREVMKVALRTLGVPPDLPLPEKAKPVIVEEPKPAFRQLAVEKENTLLAESEAPVTGPRVPDFTGLTMRAVMEKAAAEGWRVDSQGRGIARRQQPGPGGAIPPERHIRVLFGQ